MLGWLNLCIHVYRRFFWTAALRFIWWCICARFFNLTKNLIIIVWRTFSLFSGITLTKLVGVIVLRFAKSEVFVVPTSESTFNLNSCYILSSTAHLLYPYGYRSITSKCIWRLSSLDSCMGLFSYRLGSRLFVSHLLLFPHDPWKSFTHKLLNLSGHFKFMWPSSKIGKVNRTKSTTFSFGRADLTGFYLIWIVTFTQKLK